MSNVMPVCLFAVATEGRDKNLLSIKIIGILCVISREYVVFVVKMKKTFQQHVFFSFVSLFIFIYY